MPFDEGRERVARVAFVDPRGPGCVEALLLCSHCVEDGGGLEKLAPHLWDPPQRPRFTTGGRIREVGDVSWLV
jgi:hypothetical protein